jgi:hypothetical protein
MAEMAPLGNRVPVGCFGNALWKSAKVFREQPIQATERFFSGVPQPPPPWRLWPESFYFQRAA